MPKVALSLSVRPEVLTSCVVFASPHSGRDYPWSFLRHTLLDEHSIRSSEDAYVDRLFDCAPQYGASFLKAGAPRAFVDLNRAADELDPALIEGVRRMRAQPARRVGARRRAAGRRERAGDLSWEAAAGRGGSPASATTGGLTTGHCNPASTRRSSRSANRFWSTAIRCRTRPSTGWPAAGPSGPTS